MSDLDNDPAKPLDQDAEASAKNAGKLPALSEPRPRSLTPEMALNAAGRVVDRLFKDGHVDHDAEGYAQDIAKHGRDYMDGYELAKKLDDRCGWNCNLDMAEALDAWPHEAREEIRAAERAWGERNNIAPPLEIGSRVQIRSRETGTITEVYKYGVAEFCIAIDGDPKAAPPTNARRIVKFEDATLLAQGIEAREGRDAGSGGSTAKPREPDPEGDAP